MPFYSLSCRLSRLSQATRPVLPESFSQRQPETPGPARALSAGTKPAARNCVARGTGAPFVHPLPARRFGTPVPLRRDTRDPAMRRGTGRW
jgi:hypothetical protein